MSVGQLHDNNNCKGYFLVPQLDRMSPRPCCVEDEIQKQDWAQFDDLESALVN